MKKNINKMITFILVLSLCMVFFGGCSVKEKQSENTSAPSSEIPGEETEEPEEIQETPSSETVAPTQSTEEETVDLNIYGINDETLEKELVTVQIPKDSDLTADFIMNLVVENFKEHLMEIGVDKVSQDSDTVIVSFEQGTPPLANVGAGVESTILDCIAMSLLDNAKDCSKVIFRAEGEAYESGHIMLGKDEIYKWK